MVGRAVEDNVADEAEDQGAADVVAAFAEVVRRSAEGDESYGADQCGGNCELGS